MLLHTGLEDRIWQLVDLLMKGPHAMIGYRRRLGPCCSSLGHLKYVLDLLQAFQLAISTVACNGVLLGIYPLPVCLCIRVRSLVAQAIRGDGKELHTLLELDHLQGEDSHLLGSLILLDGFVIQLLLRENDVIRTDAKICVPPPIGSGGMMLPESALL